MVRDGHPALGLGRTKRVVALYQLEREQPINISTTHVDRLHVVVVRRSLCGINKPTPVIDFLCQRAAAGCHRATATEGTEH